MSNLETAIELCTKLYKELKHLGVFPALTGGTLYKEGNRKDIDIIIYAKEENTCNLGSDNLAYYLARTGITEIKDFGMVMKAKYNDQYIDLIQPQFEGKYPVEPTLFTTTKPSGPINIGILTCQK